MLDATGSAHENARRKIFIAISRATFNEKSKNLTSQFYSNINGLNVSIS